MLKILQTIEAKLAALFEKASEELKADIADIRSHALAAIEQHQSAPQPAASGDADTSVVLLGTDRSFAWFTYGDYEVSVADVVAQAADALDYSAEQWNGLSKDVRDGYVDHFYDATKGQTEAELLKMFPAAQRIKPLSDSGTGDTGAVSTGDQQSITSSDVGSASTAQGSTGDAGAASSSTGDASTTAQPSDDAGVSTDTGSTAGADAAQS